MELNHRPDLKGRGSLVQLASRFDKVQSVDDFDQVESDDEFLASLKNLATEYFSDDSRSLVTENNSPDIPFRYSLNIYRGCLHGCSYCYARPYHEYLGLNAGLDFETRIGVKYNAPALFREFLNRPNWKGEPINFSGITDCYQPIERETKLTRQCLEVALEARQPVTIITKNALVERDLDIFKELAQHHLVHVAVSVTTLDAELARTMEPRTSSPPARLRAIRNLKQSGVPVSAMIAPIIPGLNDSEIPALLKAVADAGADSAGTVLLRLPLTVKPIFLEWLDRTQPTKKTRIENLIRSCRNGELNNANFGERFRGTGQIADQIRQTYTVFKKKNGLDKPFPQLNSADFRPPKNSNGQLRLF